MISDVFSLYGDVISLKFDFMEPDLKDRLVPFDNDWHHYNPRKPHIQRKGLSITSLDGGLSGYPDLDSVKEYNELNKLSLDECDFNKVTPVAAVSPSLTSVINSFESIGRSHFIKFPPGGFFPYHRDGNFRLPVTSFRIFCLAHGYFKSDFIWLQESQRIDLTERRWYAINTYKEHAVVAFKESIITVLNIPATDANVRVLIDNMGFS